MGFTAGDLFSGMGGLASGLTEAGFDVRWANDNDPHACATFRHRLPKSRVIEKDVKELSVAGDDLSSVDVLAAAFPCQSFSQAGERAGFDDPRGQLFFEIPRLLGEWPVDQRPKLLLLENVPFFAQGEGGAWLDAARKLLFRAGYWFRGSSCWSVNVKRATRIPQDREWLFMVAASRHHFTYNPFTPPKNANSAGQLALDQIVDRTSRAAASEYLPPDNRYYRMIDREMAAGESSENIYQLRRSYVREKKGGLCPTLTANMGIGGHNVPFVRDQWGIRRLSVTEVGVLQGFGIVDFPADVPAVEQYRLLGNAVCVELARLVGEACAEALRGDGT